MAGNRKNESPLTVEQVFSRLRIRLYDIQNGDVKKNREFIWRKEDEESEDYYKNLIRFIIDNIFSFPPSESLHVIDYCLCKVGELISDPTSIINKIAFDTVSLNIPSIRMEKVKTITKLIGDELSYYSIELTKLKDQLEFQIGMAKVASGDGSEFNPPMITKTVDSANNLQSIGLSERHIPILGKVYHLVFESGDFVNRTLTSEEQFIKIFTSNNLSAVGGEIHFECETTQIAYVMEKLKGLSKDFKYSKIEKSGKFFTKNKKVLTANDISNARSDTKSPKEHKKVDSIFSS